MADYSPDADGDLQSEFVERWRDNAYGCFSSGHKFCREVCPVMQVTRNENHTPTAFHADIVAMEKGLLSVEDVADDFVHCTQCGACELRCQTRLHGRLLPPPHAHFRRGQGAACLFGTARARGLETLERAPAQTPRAVAGRAGPRACARLAEGLDLPPGGRSFRRLRGASTAQLSRAFACSKKAGVDSD